MGEPINFVHVRNGVTYCATSKWGKLELWHYGLYGLEKTLQDHYGYGKNEQYLRDYSPPAILVNEDTHDFVISIWDFDYSSCLSAFQERFRELRGFPFNRILLAHYLKMVQVVWQGWKIKVADSSTFATLGLVQTDADKIPWANPYIDTIVEEKITLPSSEIYLGFAAFHSMPACNLERFKVDEEAFLESFVVLDDKSAKQLLTQAFKDVSPVRWSKSCQERVLTMRPVLHQLRTSSTIT